MARKTIKVRICDQCKKEQVSEITLGGNSFQGWLFLNKDINPIISLYGGIKENEKNDFCSEKCLGEYIAEIIL